jgi:hypothetical protein
MVLQVANHVGVRSKEDFQPGRFYGPFDSPTDFHPFALPTDWEDVRQSEQCEQETHHHVILMQLTWQVGCLNDYRI